MKVAYITMRFPATSETFAGTDIRMLREAGVSVSVHALLAPDGDATKLLAERDLSWLAVSHGTMLANLRGLASGCRSPLLLVRATAWIIRHNWRQPKQMAASVALLPRSFGIVAELKRASPDVVHLFWGHYPSLVGYLALMSSPQAVISLFLGAYDLSKLYGGTKWLARRAHVVSTHARWNIPAIESLGVPRERIHVAYRGVDLTVFGTSSARTRRRIVAAGRLEHDKGMHDVLSVFRAVHAKWPDATLRVLGEGEGRGQLERLRSSFGLGDSVEFVGHVPHAQVARELACAEVFLHMSLEERLPNVVKEAMASGCLCVVSDTDGIDELVAHRRHGFVVRRGDIEAAASHIDDVFAERVDAAPLIKAAVEHVHSQFDCRNSMNSYRRRWAGAGALRLSTRGSEQLDGAVSQPSIKPPRGVTRDVATSVTEVIP